MECAAGDKQDMVGLDRTIFGGDRRSLDQRQQVALDALPADRAAANVAHRDLVDFVQEDDPVGLGIGERDTGHIVLVDALVGLFLDQLPKGVLDLQLAALLGRAAHRLLHHFGEVDHSDAAAARDVERHGRRLGDLDFYLGAVEAAVGEALAEAGPRRFGRALAGQRIEQPLHRRALRCLADLFAAALALQPNRLLDQVAADLLDVAADIADLGELGRLDLDERRVGQLRQAAADLGLPAARRPDHQDILRRHFLAKLGRQALAPPAVPQGDRNRLLRLILADDMLVQCGDDGLGGKIVVHGAVRWRLRQCGIKPCSESLRRSAGGIGRCGRCPKGPASGPRRPARRSRPG